MLWCEHCGGRVSTRLDANFFICCSNCGKVLQDKHQPRSVKDPQRKLAGANKESKAKPTKNAYPAQTSSAAEADQQVLFIKHIPVSEKNPKPIITHKGEDACYWHGQSSDTSERA